jgi:N4-bis(aminopropyl)spermidine synthase
MGWRVCSCLIGLFYEEGLFLIYFSLAIATRIAREYSVSFYFNRLRNIKKRRYSVVQTTNSASLCDKWCRHAGRAGARMEFDLRNAINAISDVVQNRPPPLREFDQIYMKVADMVIQAEYVARVFNDKDVVFVGDGDGIALSAAHLKAQDVIRYGPKSITLLDFDERIVNSVQRFGEKLQDRVRISAELYNVADPLPTEHFGAYDGFHINPPWGASNGGESVQAFLERGSQATKERSLGIVVIADDPALPWTQAVLRDTQIRAIELGYVIAEMQPQLHLYHLDDAPDLRSCSCLFRRIDVGCMEPTSLPLSSSRLANFYGKSSPLRYRYVRERVTLSPDKESDRLYSLDPLEVNNG